MSRRLFTVSEREFVRERASRRCEYCQFPFDYSHNAFHIEHIIPIKQGGSNDFDNLAFACDTCNTNKWAHTTGVDPESGDETRLFHPRTDNWLEHFSWSKDYAQMSGLTPIGRATIEVLKLNREGLINVRKALFAYGVHPAKEQLR